MTLPSLDAHTTAIVALLTAGQLRAGDGQRPDGAGWQGAEGASAFDAYCIVYPLPTQMDGTVGRPSDDVAGDWQVTSVSRDRHGASVVADRARGVLLDGWHSLAISGRRVMSVTYAGGGDVRRDNTSPSLFYTVDRYTLRTTTT